MSDYTHPIYGDGLAPAKVQYNVILPPDFDRPARRRFIHAAKKAGVFYAQDPTNPHRITLAFASEAEMLLSALKFEQKVKQAGRLV